MRAIPDTTDELSRRDELGERLRWLINLRWVALAGVCLAVLGARLQNLVVSIWPLVAVAAVMAVLNLGFFGLHARVPVRTLRALSAEALLQIAVDVVGLGLLIFFSGGLSNPFVFFFTFHVVIAAILLERRQAYGVALLTTGVVLFLCLADATGIGAAWPLQGALARPSHFPLAQYGLMFALGTTLLISVYMVTAIMERLRAHSRDIRRLNADLADRVEKLASAEKKLAAEHQRVRAILECMEEGVVVVDLQGKVLLSNTAAQQTALLVLDDTLSKAGCRDKEVTHIHGDACHDACDVLSNTPVNGKAQNGRQVHTHDAVNAPAEACPMGNPAACLQEILSKGGKLCAATLALLGSDPPKADLHEQVCLTPPKTPAQTQIELHGRRFENTVSAVKTAGNETLGLVVVSRDVTERRSLERQVVHAEKLHALGNLAAGVAHELNTPLGTILGYAQILLDDERGMNGEARGSPGVKELRAIEDQARRCRRIVKGLLDFARQSPDCKSAGGGREACSLNELALKIRELISHTLEMRGIALRLDLSRTPLPVIYVAVNEIEQVLVNLITNAADAIEMAEPSMARETISMEAAAHGKEHSVHSVPSRVDSAHVLLSFEPCVTLQTRAEPNGGVLIAVEDTGPGVPSGLAEQIFEPFFTTKAAGRGTGLGLSIARRIVEDHDGRLILKPRTDAQCGARFELRLPASGRAAENGLAGESGWNNEI